MRNSLALLSAAASLALGMASNASLVSADIVSWSVFDGLGGAVQACGIEVGSNAVAMAVTNPGGATWSNGNNLPAGAIHHNTTRSNKLSTTFDDFGGGGDDSWMNANLPGEWMIHLDGERLGGNVPGGVVVPPSARKYARLTTDSVARMTAYAGSGDLLIEIDQAFASTVRYGVYQDASNTLTILGSFAAGDTSATFTPTSLGGPFSFVLFYETTAIGLNFSVTAGGVPSGSATVELWDLNFTQYAVPTPGAAALVALAGVMVGRRRN